MYLFLAMNFVSTGLFAQSTPKGAKITFAEPRHDMGTINVADIELTNLEVKFTNDGDQPLIISSVKGCCGTRIVDYPAAPILPGKEGIIKVQFKLPDHEHKISRTVTIVSNDAKSPTVFRIVGEVVDKGAAPLKP